MNRPVLVAGVVLLGLLAALTLWRLSSVQLQPPAPSPVSPQAFAPAPSPTQEQNLLEQIPTKVFGGGGGPVEVVVEASHPALIWLTFIKNASEPTQARELEARQDVPAGVSTFTIDVATEVAGTAEVGLEGLPPGAKLRIRVKAPGAAELSDEILVAETTDGGASFAQVALMDWATGRSDQGPLAPAAPKKAP